MADVGEVADMPQSLLLLSRGGSGGTDRGHHPDEVCALIAAGHLHALTMAENLVPAP